MTDTTTPDSLDSIMARYREIAPAPSGFESRTQTSPLLRWLAMTGIRHAALADSGSDETEAVAAILAYVASRAVARLQMVDAKAAARVSELAAGVIDGKGQDRDGWLPGLAASGGLHPDEIFRLAWTEGKLKAEQAGESDAERANKARADEFARVKVKLCALVDSLDGNVRATDTMGEAFDRGAAHASAVTARQLRAILVETTRRATGQTAPAGEPLPFEDTEAGGIVIDIAPAPGAKLNGIPLHEYPGAGK